MSCEAAQAVPAPKILLIKPSSLGDIVHTLPVLAALRRKYPAAHLAWLVGSAFAPILQGHPLLDELIAFDRRHYGSMLTRARALRDFVAFTAGLRRRRFDLVLDLQGLIRSGFLALASGAPRRVGFARAREGAWACYTQRVACPRQIRHAVDKNLHLARAVGLEPDPPQFPLGITAEERRAAAALLSRAGVQAGEEFIAVLAGARWESKRWTAAGFAQLVRGASALGLPRCVLLGGADERGSAAEISAGCGGLCGNLVGQTNLRELTALLERCAAVVCVDSGPMHIAAALDRPIVALFGPTDETRTGPYSRRASVIRNALPCAPCLARRCPLKHQECMQKLKPERVLAALQAALRGAAGPAAALQDARPRLVPERGSSGDSGYTIRA